MRCFTRLGLALAVTLSAAACGENPVGSRDDATQVARGATINSYAYCTSADHGDLLSLAAQLFGEGSPNYNSVRGKLNNLQHQAETGNVTAKKSKAHDIIDFVLVKNAESALPGGDLIVTDAGGETTTVILAFVNGVYCFAGIDITLLDPNSTLIFPNDEPQTVYSDDGNAGIYFPGDPVDFPTLITFSVAGNYPGRSGPLNTKLDQYPGFLQVTSQSENGGLLGLDAFGNPIRATVAVCVTAPRSVFVRGGLKLGHGRNELGSQVVDLTTPDAGVPLPNIGCTYDLPTDAPVSLVRKATSVIFGANAEEESFTGGLGGTVTEFSPFGGVDTELEFGGGLGGTVTEFTREALLRVGATTTASVHAACSVPYGAQVTDSACVPSVRVTTSQGTPLSVPITWEVVAGGGRISNRTSGLGTVADPIVCTNQLDSKFDVTSFGVTTSVGGYPTDAGYDAGAGGRSAVCWTVGNYPGTNQVRVTATAGGEAPAGVTFVDALGNQSSVRDFFVEANPVASLGVSVTPVGGIVAGTAFSVSVAAVDEHGDAVLAFDGDVTVVLNGGTFSAGTTTATAVDGVASFSGLQVNAAGSYSVSASATAPTDGVGGTTTVNGTSSGTFGVIAAAPAIMTYVQGPQSFSETFLAYATPVPVDPTVRITDAFGNPNAGLVVTWTTYLTDGTVSAPTSTTGANGQASTAWTLGDGQNRLEAEYGSLELVFSATGTTNYTVLNSCPIVGSGDPINDPSKQYAFWIPGPGAGKTIRSIELAFSSAGTSNYPKEYDVELSYQRGGFAGPSVSTVQRVLLRGNNSENARATFKLSQPIVGAGGQNVPVNIRLRVLNAEDAAKISFNTGPCAPGTRCKTSCFATEVVGPFWDTYRKSVGITVKGSQ